MVVYPLGLQSSRCFFFFFFFFSISPVFNDFTLPMTDYLKFTSVSVSKERTKVDASMVLEP